MLKNRSRQVALLAVIPVSLALLVMSGCSRDPNVRKQKYLESGKRYEKDGKYKEAFIQFSNALKVDKSFGDAHYELAKTYLKLGQIKPGYGELMRTVELSPKNLQARIDLGGLLLAGNAVDRATEQANAVIAADPNNADAYALLSTISARKGDRPGALANIQHALSIDPNRAAFHTTLALIDSSDPATGTSSEQELQKAITLDAKDIHARMVLAALLEKKGDHQGAEQQYLAAIQQSPKDLQPRAGLGGLYMREGDKAKAEQILHKAVEDLSDSDQASELLKDYYIRTGQVDAGLASFADLYSKYPKSFPIKLNYATMVGAKGDYDKLGPLVDQLSKTNGSQTQVVLLKSAMLLKNGKVNDAVDSLQAATKNAPDNAQLQISLGKVALLKGDVNLSEASFRAADKIAPGNLEVQAGLAQVANQKGDSGLLMQVAEKTIASHPELGQGYFWRASAEANQKQFDKAEADLQTSLAKSPNNAAAYVELGQFRMKEKKFPEATAMFEKALEKDPNFGMALSQLATIDVNQKQPEKAIARVQQQITASPKNPGFYTLLADIQMSTKDFNGARDNAKKAMDIAPADEGAVQMYAQAVEALGDKDAAIAVWQKWESTHPKDGAATSMLALLEERKGDQGKAIEYYKKTLAIDPNQSLAANNLAYLMVQNGQNADLALSYAQMARRGMPNSPNTADTLAWVNYYKGTYLTARDLLEDALKQSPNDAAMHYHLGMTYSKLGRKSDAIIQLKKASELAPNTQTSKDATAALAQLG